MTEQSQSKAKIALSPLAHSITLFSSHQHLFTKSDIILANFIVQNFESFQHMTILDLAKATDLSEITISRFCKKLDLAGVQALKMKLTYFISASMSTALLSNNSLLSTSPSNEALDTTDSDGTEVEVVAPQAQQENTAAILGAILGAQQRDFTPDDSMQTICTQVFTTITAGLQQTLGLIDFAAIDRAAELLDKSKRVLLFGYGNSSVVCHDLGTRLVRFGLSCEIVSDLHQQITLATLCDADTVIITVSFSGSSLHLDEILKIAQDRGAKSILFTSYLNSPIARQADVVLIGVCPEIKNNTEASFSRLIYMAIGDALYTRLTLLRAEQYQRNLQDLREALAILKS